MTVASTIIVQPSYASNDIQTTMHIIYMALIDDKLCMDTIAISHIPAMEVIPHLILI